MIGNTTKNELEALYLFHSPIPMVDILDQRIKLEAKRRTVDGETEPITEVWVRNSCLHLIAEELGKMTGNWQDPTREHIFFGAVWLRPFVASLAHDTANAHLGYFIFRSEKGEHHGI